MAKKQKTLTVQVKELTERLQRIEAVLEEESKPKRDHKGQEKEPNHFCCLPEVLEREFDTDISDSRERLIRLIDKKWVNGTKLRYYFFKTGDFSGDAAHEQLVRDAFDIWKDVGIGLEFEEISEIEEAEIRIGFLRDGRSWSYVGRDVIDIPGQFERTMNFGWDLTQDSRGLDTPVHEIGHTLGFPHEHQNPISGIIWDEPAVYDYFGGPPNNWAPEVTYHNVLRKLPASAVDGSPWDPNSVMHYSFAPGLIQSPAQYASGLQPELGLSALDRSEVKKFYPPIPESQYERLAPFDFELLSLAPAEQKNFILEPNATRDYDIQTFGNSDTVMVLFEEVNGELKFLAGDDDSGTRLNAHIVQRLYPWRKYVLRIRMYLNYASGNTGVMLW
ncbi:MAG: hypothetical protein Mars2KO_26060 [Maribacter sp.]